MGPGMKQLDLRMLDAATPLKDVAVIDLGAAERYVLHWVRNPAPGSFFAKFTWFVRWLPRVPLLAALRLMRYGGTILFLDGVPIGHLFYQQQWFNRGNEVHMFAVKVDEAHRDKGYANRLMRAFLLEMGQRSEIDYVRLSAGGDEAVRHMWKKARDGEYDLPFTLVECAKPGFGWLLILR